MSIILENPTVHWYQGHPDTGSGNHQPLLHAQPVFKVQSFNCKPTVDRLITSRNQLIHAPFSKLLLNKTSLPSTALSDVICSVRQQQERNPSHQWSVDDVIRSVRQQQERNPSHQWSVDDVIRSVRQQQERNPSHQWSVDDVIRSVRQQQERNPSHQWSVDDVIRSVRQQQERNPSHQWSVDDVIRNVRQQQERNPSHQWSVDDVIGSVRQQQERNPSHQWSVDDVIRSVRQQQERNPSHQWSVDDVRGLPCKGRLSLLLSVFRITLLLTVCTVDPRYQKGKELRQVQVTAMGTSGENPRGNKSA